MKVGPAHLTYCTNIHPGETWDEVRANVAEQVVAVKARVAPDRPFGVGLRLSALAAQALAKGEALEEFRDLLRRQDLYVFTINAFPFGAFHGTAVKERVYRPDWLEPERAAYTELVAGLLADLLPPGDVAGSISTVPGCFRPRASGPDAPARIGAAVGAQAAALWRLREVGRPLITLALEPEPECLLETTADAVSFLDRHVFAGAGAQAFRDSSGLSGPAVEAALRRHVGICLDACHAAVEYEHPAAAVAAVQAAGVGIFKVQVSAGLRLLAPGPQALEALQRFAEGVYLHQVVIRRGDSLTRIVDLPEALQAARAGDAGDEWRIHFHVPLFRESLGSFASTRPFLAELLALHRRQPLSDHLEVETYTWDVLPEEFRREPVAEAVARELRWTVGELQGATA